MLFQKSFHVVLAGTLVLGACQSTGLPDVSAGVRVELTDARVGTTLGVVNDAYLVLQGLEGETAALRRSAYYSERRSDVWTKVAEDDVVAGLVRALDRAGLGRHGMDGPAQRAEGTTLTIFQGRDQRHFQYRRDLSPEALRAYQECRNAFMDVYNYLPQYQATDPTNIRLEESPDR